MKKARYLAELEVIRKKSGGFLKAEDVVSFARNPRTALHRRFEWDDSVAAHAYRLEQARLLIRVAVTVIPFAGGDRVISAYVSLMGDRTNKGGGYRSLEIVMRNKKLRSLLLEQALADANAWRAKYEGLTELAPLFDALDQIQSSRRRKKKAG